MDIFLAVAEPTRRAIVELIANSGQLSATAISDRFEASPSAISQHLKALREAGVLTMEKHAQQRLYQLNPEAMHELETWAKKMADRWEERYTALDAVLEREKAKLQNVESNTPRRD